jgi:hypothetical protein
MVISSIQNVDLKLTPTRDKFFLSLCIIDQDLPSPPLSSETRKTIMIELFEARYPYIAKTAGSQRHDQANNAAAKTDSWPKFRIRTFDTRLSQTMGRRSSGSKCFIGIYTAVFDLFKGSLFQHLVLTSSRHEEDIYSHSCTCSLEELLFTRHPKLQPDPSKSATTC